MDAELATVLGVAAGALGTVVTGATAALVSRSMARQHLDKLATTLIPLDRVERFPEKREEWVENAHKRWNAALKYRQTEVHTQRGFLQMDATHCVSEAALQVAKRCVLLGRSTGRAIADLKGHDLDTKKVGDPGCWLRRRVSGHPRGPEADTLWRAR